MNRTALILSIKPEFVEKIFNGSKTIELRKVKPSIKIGEMVIVYSTVPIKAIIGICRVKDILEESPKNLWLQHSDELGVSNIQFWDYYKDAKKSIGIVLEEVCRFDSQINLSDIKNIYPTFQPPQSFKYISQHTALKSFKQLTN